MKSYKPTKLEKYISSIYVNNDLITIEDISKEKICESLNIELYKHNVTCTYFTDDFKAITLNKNKDQKQQNFEFFHELSNIFLFFGHTLGGHSDLSLASKQEIDNIHSYVALPLHILEEFDVYDPEVIKELSAKLSLPKSIVKQRIESVRRQMSLQMSFYQDKFKEKLKSYVQ